MRNNSYQFDRVSLTDERGREQSPKMEIMKLEISGKLLNLVQVGGLVLYPRPTKQGKRSNLKRLKGNRRHQIKTNMHLFIHPRPPRLQTKSNKLYRNWTKSHHQEVVSVEEVDVEEVEVVLRAVVAKVERSILLVM